VGTLRHWSAEQRARKATNGSAVATAPRPAE
jgi:hypothetical protein